MASFLTSECRIPCYNMLCSQECLSGSALNAEAQNHYRVWLSQKVEKAVEKALQYERQKKMLEDYALSRNWAMPQICEERRLVTMKIHSLLLQWKPDFSAQWGLKVRRALPIIESTFSLMACCIEDYSQPLLIEPRLKKVLSLLESVPCQNQSIPQSSTQQSLLILVNSFHHRDLRLHISSAKHTHQAEGKACAGKTCRLVEEQLGVGRKGSQHAGFDKGTSATMVQKSCIGESTHSHGQENMAEQKAFSRCSFCVQFEGPLERLNAKTQKACSCRSSMADDFEAGNVDDSFEWSKANLQSRGTVATLMASELRSSRKEEADQALLSALASQDVQSLEDNWNKHSEFASKSIVKKIMELKSKKKERDLGLKRVVDKLLHAAAEEKCPNTRLPSQIKRSTSKGLLGLLRISCGVPASGESPLAFAETPSSNVLEASEMSTCCLLRMHSKHTEGQDEKSHATQAKLVMPSLPNPRKSSALTTADHNRNDDGGIDSYHPNHDDVHSHNNEPHNNEHSEGSSGIASACSFSGESDKPEAALVGHDYGDKEILLRHGCVIAQAELAHDASPLSDGSDSAESSMVACTHIEDGNAIPADVDHANNVPCGETPQDRPPVSSASRSLAERREDLLNFSQEDKGSCMISVRSDEDRQGQAGTAHANMQTGLLIGHRERPEELELSIVTGITSEGNEGQVVMAAEGSRSRDEERQEAGGRRVRVPLSSLLAERDDLSARNPTVSSSWRELGGNCAWDTWEEPNEALDPLCCVCMIGLRGAAFTPCGHTFCRKCSRELWKARGTCPLCNKFITSILDIF